MFQRNVALDAARGIGIFVMILLHVLTFRVPLEGTAAPSWQVTLALSLLILALVLLVWLRPCRSIGLERITRRGIFQHAIVVTILAAFLTGLWISLEHLILQRVETPIIGAGNALVPGIMFFFFTTGAALAFSLDRRKHTENWPTTARHVALRYGSLIIVGVVAALLFLPADWVWAWREPVSEIGLAGLVTFPLVYALTRRRLLVLAVILAALTPLAVLSVLPTELTAAGTGVIAYMIFLGPFSLTKALPAVLVGGVFGKELVSRGRVSWQATTAGSVLFIAVAIAAMLWPPTSLSIYYAFLLTTTGFGIVTLGILDLLARRGVAMQLFLVLGRASLVIYVLHAAIITLLRRLGILIAMSVEEAVLFGVLTLAVLCMIGYDYLQLRSQHQTT